MRHLIFVLFTCIALPVALPAAAQSTLSIPAIEVNKADRSQSDSKSTTGKQKGIPLDGLSRSDMGLIEAEKLIAEKKYSLAISVLEKITARNPRNSEAHVAQALAWLNLGQLDRAKQSIEYAQIADKNHLGAYVVSGLISMMQKDVQQAEYTLSALRVACLSDTCPEYQTLQRIIRETKPAAEK